MSPPPVPTSAPSSRPLSARITDAWQQRGPLACALLPLSWVYAGLSAARSRLYQLGWLPSYRAPVPVIVIGNVIAGGGGKTPVTMHLVQALQARGWRPTVVSRGYGRSKQTDSTALAVRADSDPNQVGDEPLLIAQRTGVPVFVANQRALAAQAALAAHPHTDVLICDDGLQHLALARDVEIAVFNRLGVGNGWQLPAGPLREAWPRRLDMALYANEPPAQLAASGAATWPVRRQLADYAITQRGQQIPLAELRGRQLRALAAVAYPQEFFSMLQAAGLALERSDALPDHADLADPQWLARLGLTAGAGPTINAPVLLCTEKDAHKLWRIAPQALAVPLQVVIDAGFAEHVAQRLQTLRPRHPQ